MEPLRIVLFLGLVSHKVLWEVLKKRDSARATKTQPAGLVKWFVKPAKILALGIFCAPNSIFGFVAHYRRPTCIADLGRFALFRRARHRRVRARSTGQKLD